MDYCYNIEPFGRWLWGILLCSSLPTFSSYVAEAEGMLRWAYSTWRVGGRGRWGEGGMDWWRKVDGISIVGLVVAWYFQLVIPVLYTFSQENWDAHHREGVAGEGRKDGFSGRLRCTFFPLPQFECVLSPAHSSLDCFSLSFYHIN